MKFGQLLSVVIIAGLVGVGSNIGYTYLTTERPNSDEVKFKEFLESNWEDGLEKSPVFATLLGDKGMMIKFQAIPLKTLKKAKSTINTY